MENPFEKMRAATAGDQEIIKEVEAEVMRGAEVVQSKKRRTKKVSANEPEDRLRKWEVERDSREIVGRLGPDAQNEDKKAA